MLAGADEAGRGPVLGPLVVAAVGLPDGQALPPGVRDSKIVPAPERESLAKAILAGLPTVVVVLEPDEIDRAVARAGLNTLEHRAIADAAGRLGATRLIVDTVGPAEACRAALCALLPATEVEARARADAEVPLVGAASIVAKVERDARIRQLEARIGEPIGSGYPSDPVTREFLASWHRRHADWPPGTRRSWQTLPGIRQALAQKRLQMG